jgi:hypothetical protein
MNCSATSPVKTGMFVTGIAIIFLTVFYFLDKDSVFFAK